MEVTQNASEQTNGLMYTSKGKFKKNLEEEICKPNFLSHNKDSFKNTHIKKESSQTILQLKKAKKEQQINPLFRKKNQQNKTEN